MAHNDPGSARGRGLSRWLVALVAFFAIGAFFLFSEHRAHSSFILAWLLLLACPLLHFWMHGGHGSHGEEDTPASREQDTGAHRH
jgi:hypothetical protein